MSLKELIARDITGIFMNVSDFCDNLNIQSVEINLTSLVHYNPIPSQITVAIPVRYNLMHGYYISNIHC